MFKATPDGKHLVELSLKQREQFFRYTMDKRNSNFAKEYPPLQPSSSPPLQKKPA